LVSVGESDNAILFIRRSFDVYLRNKYIITGVLLTSES